VQINESDPNILDITSNEGHFASAFGPFHFEGQWWSDSGKMELVRCHAVDTIDMPMQAILTPFGNIACWAWTLLDNASGFGNSSEYEALLLLSSADASGNFG